MFSVIVPCYNVEKYLNQCVDSLLSQTCPDFEILLIDDGSTDGTGRLCDELAEKDRRIWVQHKPNGGLSNARNYGIERATGDYLVFVDSDDFVAPGALEAFVSCTGDRPDVIISSIMEYYDDKDNRHRDFEAMRLLKDHPSCQEAVRWIMTQSMSVWPSVKYIVSRRFVEENGFAFKKGFLHEDLDWTSRLCQRATSFEVCRTEWYYHRMGRQGSITSTISSRHLTDVLAMAYDLIFNDQDPNGDRIIKSLIDQRILQSVFTKLRCYRDVPKEQRQPVISCMQECMPLFKMSVSADFPVKYRIFSAAVRLLGVKNALTLLSLLPGGLSKRKSPLSR